MEAETALAAMAELEHSWLTVESPVGRLTITARGEAIVAIDWAGSSAVAGDRIVGNGALLGEAARQLDAYFAGRLTRFDLALAPAGSRFEQLVWMAMRAIPYGKTRCYGELAAAVGSAPRAVGRACGRNPIPIVIPCHRVLARTGLGGYSGAGGLTTKRRLLMLEGACC